MRLIGVVILAAILVLALRAAEAQPAGKVYRVGWLGSTNPFRMMNGGRASNRPEIRVLASRPLKLAFGPTVFDARKGETIWLSP